MTVWRGFAGCRPSVSPSSSGTVCDMVDPEDENAAADGSRLGCECCRSAIGYCDIRGKNEVLDGITRKILRLEVNSASEKPLQTIVGY